MIYPCVYDLSPGPYSEAWTESGSSINELLHEIDGKQYLKELVPPIYDSDKVGEKPKDEGERTRNIEFIKATVVEITSSPSDHTPRRHLEHPQKSSRLKNRVHPLSSFRQSSTDKDKSRTR